MNNKKSGANKYEKLLSATATEIWSTFSALYMAVDQLFWLNWHQVIWYYLSQDEWKNCFHEGCIFLAFPQFECSYADLYQLRQEAHYHWLQFVSLCIFKCSPKRQCYHMWYDTVSDVVESGVHWRSDFQIGSRVLKKILNLFLCISMACNMISCIEVAEITQTLKIAEFTM